MPDRQQNIVLLSLYKVQAESRNTALEVNRQNRIDWVVVGLLALKVLFEELLLRYPSHPSVTKPPNQL